MENNEFMQTPPSQNIPNNTVVGQPQPIVKAIGEREIDKALQTLRDYKEGKKNLEIRIVRNEQFWKMRHWEGISNRIPATAWAWNVIVSKHADLSDAFPEPNILPREENDKVQAEILSEIVPVVLDQCDFKNTYDDCGWYKLKQGTSVYGVFWDKDKLNGLGDIAIKKIDLLNLFWEPGISHIQDSRNLFHTELIDKEVLKAMYPQLTDKVLETGEIFTQKYLYDDTVKTDDKTTVIDWYYKKHIGNKTVLHYVKFVGNTVLYATENETTPPSAPMTDPNTGAPAVNPETGNTVSIPVGKPLSETGLYDHGEYPFVFDALFKVEGSPCGYGYTDINKETQINIDKLNAAIIRNAIVASKRRYFALDGLDINLEDFANTDKDIVSVSSQMTDETLREITTEPLPGIYVDVLNNQVEMMKETSGNRDVSTGGTTAGVTSASGIAALQEASGKQSRDIISTTYEAYRQIVLQVIELIRQFYDLPRQFRVVGERGQQKFITFNNAQIKPQKQPDDFGIYMGYRVPQFDIDVSAQRANPYNKVARNDLAIQMYNLQFFNPQNATQAIACLEFMDFDNKDEVLSKIEKNGQLFDFCQQIFQIGYQLAGTYDQRFLEPLMQIAVQAGIMTEEQQTMQQQSISAQGGAKAMDTDSLGNPQAQEHAFVRKARERAQNAATV